jgi:hypothetical protein
MIWFFLYVQVTVCCFYEGEKEGGIIRIWLVVGPIGREWPQRGRVT